MHIMKGELKWQNILFSFLIILVISLVFLIILSYVSKDASGNLAEANDLLCFWC